MIERGIAGFGLVWLEGCARGGVGRDTLYVICSQYMKRYIWIGCLCALCAMEEGLEGVGEVEEEGVGAYLA